MAYLLVHESDASRAILDIANPNSENYLCGLEIDRLGVCKPGVMFRIQESLLENIPPVFTYLPLCISKPTWYDVGKCWQMLANVGKC